ncbi:hypothetical protein HC248_00842 [Polaromonas vacuolata]|uniref:Uncharacterized protein n=1 Tax=Polaromonas vacuolata TaxID=37448 RepID=A0A6H2H6Q7_9BURK|nr:hypothetical protein [Polaromonas vacuolata]QJC55561.1 hypothetical protein HC248_00842 [Polaromonas vacuolata]
MREIANMETLAVLDYLEETVHPIIFSRLKRRQRLSSGLEARTREIETIHARLLRFDRILAELELEGQPIYDESDSSRWEWLTYLEECKIIPVYDDALALMHHRKLVDSMEVQNILKFISVASSTYGVDKAENHSYGYHFHFGKVKKNTLNRFNVVLTFDNRKLVLPKSHDSLFAEEHGSGRYRHIDIATVGDNVRLPIFKICE